MGGMDHAPNQRKLATALYTMAAYSFALAAFAGLAHVFTPSDLVAWTSIYCVVAGFFGVLAEFIDYPN